MSLGSLELLVMLAVRRSAPKRPTPAEAYRNLEVRHPNPPSFGAFYTTLDRLVVKGLLTEGRGRAKSREFKLSAEGISRLREWLKLIADMEGPFL